MSNLMEKSTALYEELPLFQEKIQQLAAVMKVNLNVPFMNYKGFVITKKVEGTDVEQEQLMKDVIAPILFSGDWRDERVNALSGDEKIRAYSLSLKIYQSTGNIEISAEEALMIKEAALVLNPGGYAQIVKLIDG